jgi:hypothetical protein
MFAFPALRRSAVGSASILLVAVLLQGCIVSDFPLLSDETAVVDPFLTGQYDVVGLDKDTFKFDVYLRKRKYLLAHGSMAYIGTVHSWSNGKYIAQIRELGKTYYAYFVFNKTRDGVELSAIACPTAGSVCTARDVQELTRLMASAELQSHEKIPKATKTGGIGQ